VASPFSRPWIKASAEGFCLSVLSKGMVLCHRREDTSFLIRFVSVQKILDVTVLHLPKFLFVVRSGPELSRDVHDVADVSVGP